jgi:hypothetical protein
LVQITQKATSSRQRRSIPRELAHRVLLDSIDPETLEELEPWFSAQKGSALVKKTTFDKVRTVREKRFRQIVVPCSNFGGSPKDDCIDVGKRGGAYIARAASSR